VKRRKRRGEKVSRQMRKGVTTLLLGVPGKGYCLLAGESPAMVRARSHVAWMAGGNGNIAF
jgi:hypothetical protein